MKPIKRQALSDYLKSMDSNEYITIGFIVDGEEGDYVAGQVSDFSRSRYIDSIVLYHYQQLNEEHFILDKGGV